MVPFQPSEHSRQSIATSTRYGRRPNMRSGGLRPPEGALLRSPTWARAGCADASSPLRRLRRAGGRAPGSGVPGLTDGQLKHVISRAPLSASTHLGPVASTRLEVDDALMNSWFANSLVMLLFILIGGY